MDQIEKVIEVHEKLLNLAEAPFAFITAFLCAFILVISINELFKCIKAKDFSFLLKFLLPVFIVFIAVEGYLIHTIIHYDFSLSKEKWKTEYLIPYVKAQPEHKIDVENFSQLLKTPENEGVPSIYFNDKAKPVWLKLTLLNQSGSKKVLVTQAVIKKESIQRAYLTYKTVQKDITKQYTDNVYYRTVLHIPEN